jgi:hypothetical protein
MWIYIQIGVVMQGVTGCSFILLLHVNIAFTLKTASKEVGMADVVLCVGNLMMLLQSYMSAV